MLIYEKRGAIAVVTRNRPAARNAITPEMACRMADAFADASADDAVRVVILTGAGEKALCSGGDLVNAAKQASESGVIAGGQKLAGFWMTTTDVHAIGLPTAQGIYYAEAFYWDQDDQARAWSRRFHDRVGAMPNSYQAGIYGAVTHYLKAVKAAGTADAATVMAKMRELPIEDFMTRHGTVRLDERVVRDIRTLQVKAPADSKGEWDLARMVATIPGDQAFRPLADSDCPLVKQ